MHIGCVFVAGIYLSRTWMSGSFESVWRNAYVHRLDLGLYSHPIEIRGNGVRTHGNSKRKITSTRKILLRGGLNPRRCIRQDSEPNTSPAELFRSPDMKRTRRANAQTIHTHHAYRTHLWSSPLPNQSPTKVCATSGHFTKDRLHKSQLSCGPETLCEGQGQLHKNETVDSCV